MAYHRHLTRKQAEMEATDSREEEAKKLPPECQAACAERQAQSMPVRTDMIPVGLESTLYPNWTQKPDTKPKGKDWAEPYRTQKEEDARK